MGCTDGSAIENDIDALLQELVKSTRMPAMSGFVMDSDYADVVARMEYRSLGARVFAGPRSNSTFPMRPAGP